MFFPRKGKFHNYILFLGVRNYMKSFSELFKTQSKLAC